MTEPLGAVIEIIERGAKTDGTAGQSVIVPDDVRINGHSLLMDTENPVIVHEMKVDKGSLVSVTLTLLVRRVSIRAEHDTD
jgi:hypothetical protein